MHHDLLNSINTFSSFFDTPVVLHCEKENYFQYNTELTHPSAFQENENDTNNEIHPVFDPVVFNPLSEFHRGEQIVVDRPNFDVFTKDSVKYHIGLLKPYDSTNGTRRWMMAGEQLILMISTDGKEFFVYNPTMINSKSRYFLIKENDVPIKFTIKSLLSKLDGAIQLFNDIYMKEKSATFEWFFKSIVVSGGFPPVVNQTFGFYKSLLQHPQFLYIFAVSLAQNALKPEVVEAWYKFSHDNFPTIYPSLVIMHLNTQGKNPTVFFNKSLIGHVTRYIISQEIGQKLPITGSKIKPDVLMAQFIQREWSPECRFIFYTLFSIYKKYNDLNFTFESLSILFFGNKCDEATLSQMTRFSTIYSIFPQDYKLFTGLNVTVAHASAIMTAVLQSKDTMLNTAMITDFPKIVQTITKIYSTGNYVITAEDDYRTQDIKDSERRKSVQLASDVFEVEARNNVYQSVRPKSISMSLRSASNYEFGANSEARLRPSFIVSSTTELGSELTADQLKNVKPSKFDFSDSDRLPDDDASVPQQNRLPKPPKEAIEEPVKTLSDEYATHKTQTDEATSSKVLSMGPVKKVETPERASVVDDSSSEEDEEESSDSYVLSTQDFHTTDANNEKAPKENEKDEKNDEKQKSPEKEKKSESVKSKKEEKSEEKPKSEDKKSSHKEEKKSTDSKSKKEEEKKVEEPKLKPVEEKVSKYSVVDDIGEEENEKDHKKSNKNKFGVERHENKHDNKLKTPKKNKYNFDDDDEENEPSKEQPKPKKAEPKKNKYSVDEDDTAESIEIKTRDVKGEKEDSVESVKSIEQPKKPRKKVDYNAYSSESEISTPKKKIDDDKKSVASTVSRKSSIADTPDPVSLDTNDYSPTQFISSGPAVSV